MEASQYITQGKPVVEVTLMGPPASGKSLIEAAVLELAEKRGLSVEILSYQTPA